MYTLQDKQQKEKQSELNFRYMDERDLNMVFSWCKEEGWNVGVHDPSLYYRLDPKGHMLFLKNDEPVGAISIIKHRNDFFTLGPFIVKKEYRSLGYGTKIWQQAMKTIEKNIQAATIALYSIPTQVDRYQKLGFKPALNTQGWQMKNQPLTQKKIGSECEIITPDRISAISLYDESIFAVSRKTLLSDLITLSSVTGFMLKDENGVTGFGIIRPCVDGYRVGPLFANAAENAKKLFLRLLEAVGEEKIVIDMPSDNKNAIMFAQYFSLTPIFNGDTNIMFKGEPPENFLKNIDKHYGVFSLEIG